MNNLLIHQVVRARIHADDFAQQQIKDVSFYKNRSNTQIKNAVQAILNATNQHDFTAAIAQANAFIDAALDYDFTAAIAQANAFIDAALDYEFIDIFEKAKWLDDIADAVRTQTIEESA